MLFDLTAKAYFPADFRQSLGSSAAHALREKDTIASATVRDWFWSGPFDDGDATGLDRIQSYAALDGNLSQSFTSKFGQSVSWRRWEQPDPRVRAPSLPLAWLLAWGKKEGDKPNATEVTVGSAAFSQGGIAFGSPMER